MSFAKKSSLLAISLTLLGGACTHTRAEVKKESPFVWEFSGTLKTGDTYYGKNTSLLNNCESQDRVFYTKNSLDISADLSYLEAAQAHFTMRTKATWGSAEIAPITTAPTKILDSVGQDHKHFIPRHIFWMREAWLMFSLTQAANMNILEQTLTLGAFSFALGRGIALGAAYAVSPNYLGFYSDSAVDQYAFGAKLSGEIVKDRLSYDFYGATLDNRSNSLSKTGKKIYGQQYGLLTNQERGFGHINYVLAGRLNWIAVDDEKKGKLICEPYFLYNSDPEQNVEFLADAQSRLGTIGVAAEFVGDRFEFGFDTAFNFGHQKVLGWDRNVIEAQNRNGDVMLVNSHVFVNVNPESDNAANVKDWNAYKAPYVSSGIVTTVPANNGNISGAGKATRNLVDSAVRDSGQNGKTIGVVTSTDTDPNGGADRTSTLSDIRQLPELVTNDVQANELFNATDRFRDQYKNQYKGWMLVTDMAGCFYNKDLKIAFTGAYVSGDLDPNSTLKDGDYKGFIGLQELYAGKRVKSAFFLGSAGRLNRPLDIPETERQPNRFAAIASGMTNLALIGVGATWEPSDWNKPFTLNPNILAFWETFPDKAFDAINKKSLSCPSRTFLGVECNLFMKKELLENLKFYLVTSVFIPGSHYKDVKGKPMDDRQWKILDRWDPTGYNGDNPPGLGTDLSFTANIGFEYKF